MLRYHPPETLRTRSHPAELEQLSRQRADFVRIKNGAGPIVERRPPDEGKTGAEEVHELETGGREGTSGHGG